MFGTNLAVAATIARALGVPPEEMAHGIETTTWPGRNELLHRNGQELTLLDCAHNPDGAVTLSHVIDASLMGAVGSRRDVALVFGSLQKKNWRAMLARLDHAAAHHIFRTCPPVSGAVDPTVEIVAEVPGESHSPICAMRLARARSPWSAPAGARHRHRFDDARRPRHARSCWVFLSDPPVDL